MSDAAKMILGGAAAPSVERGVSAAVVNPNEVEEEKKKRMAEEAAKAKAKGMKKGGYVKAADGCAKKGKTKGRMV